MCAEFLGTFIFVFVVVSCVVFTNETRFIPAVVTLTRAPRSDVSALAAPAAAAAPPRALPLVSTPSPLAPLYSPSPPPPPPPLQRWLLSDQPPPAWLPGSHAARPRARPQPQPQPPHPQPRRAQQPVSASGTTTLFVTVESFGMSRWLLIALALGFMIGALVFSVGSISGANLNPAVSLALAVAGKLSWFRAAAYAGAQCAGSALGALVVRSLAPALFLAAGGGANGVVRNPAVGVWTVLGGEILGTAVLTLAVSAAADVGREQKSKYQGALTPLMIGLAVAFAHLCLIPVDGCSLNPARSFGPALAMGAFADQWLFWVGPCTGAVLASLSYSNLFVGYTLSCGAAGAEEEGGGGGGAGGDRASDRGGRPAAQSFSSAWGGGEREGGGSGGSGGGKGGALASPELAPRGASRSVSERFSLEGDDEDSLESVSAGSAQPTPLLGGAGAGAPAAIDVQLTLAQAQGRAGAVAAARGEGGGGALVRRLSASPFPVAAAAAAGGAQQRQGVQDW